jgi:hypothetical protein
MSVLQIVQEFLQSTAVEGERLRNRSSNSQAETLDRNMRQYRPCVEENFLVFALAADHVDDA